MAADRRILSSLRTSFGAGEPGTTAETVAGRALVRIAWSVAGGVLSQGGMFFTSVALARILGSHEFGRFAMIQSTAIALSALASLGLGTTATKYVSQYRKTQRDRAGLIMGLSSQVAIAAAVCCCSLLLWFAPSVAAGGGLSATELRISAIYVFFTTLSGYQMGALAGMEAFRQIARISFIYGPATFALHGALAWRFGIRGAVLAQGGGALLLWLLCGRALAVEGRRHGITTRYRGAWRERGVLFRFSIPATLSGIAGSVAIWWCNALLVKVGGYALLGLFTVASTLRMMVLFLPGLNIRVTSPLLNNLLASGDDLAYRRTYWTATLCNGAIAVLLATFFWVAGPWLLRLFGRQFAASPLLVLLLLCAAVVEVITTNLYQALFASRSLWWQTAIVLVWIAVLVSFSILAIPGYGAAGLAFAYLAAWCVTAVLYGTMAPFGRRSALRSPAIALNPTAI